MKKISVIVAAYNEEQVINECYVKVKEELENLNNYEYEIIFVNDGSRDNTLNLLEDICKSDKNIKVLSFTRNFGHQAAVTAGLKYVKGNVVCIIDADMQDSPKHIPYMLKYWEKGYDIVYGKRKKRKAESVFKLLTAKIFYIFLNKLSNVKIPKNTGDFRLIDRRVVDTINNFHV